MTRKVDAYTQLRAVGVLRSPSVKGRQGGADKAAMGVDEQPRRPRRACLPLWNVKRVCMVTASCVRWTALTLLAMAGEAEAASGWGQAWSPARPSAPALALLGSPRRVNTRVVCLSGSFTVIFACPNLHLLFWRAESVSFWFSFPLLV